MSHALDSAKRTCEYVRQLEKRLRQAERENKQLRDAVQRAQQAAQAAKEQR